LIALGLAPIGLCIAYASFGWMYGLVVVIFSVALFAPVCSVGVLLASASPRGWYLSLLCAGSGVAAALVWAVEIQPIEAIPALLFSLLVLALTIAAGWMQERAQ
jgi:hypothetical protein